MRESERERERKEERKKERKKETERESVYVCVCMCVCVCVRWGADIPGKGNIHVKNSNASACAGCQITKYRAGQSCVAHEHKAVSIFFKSQTHLRPADFPSSLTPHLK